MSSLSVLGVDLSLNATGLAMIDYGEAAANHVFDLRGGRKMIRYPIGVELFDGNLPFYTGTVIRSEAGDTFGRWSDILAPIVQWAKHAHVVMIEGYAFGSNSSYHDAIVEIGGIVRYHLRLMGHVPIEVSPSTLKKFATGNGRAEKPDMVSSAQKFCPHIDDDNMADAFHLVRLGHALQANHANDLPRHQREVVATLKYPTPKIRKTRAPKLNFGARA